jgi:hypothetical protein
MIGLIDVHNLERVRIFKLGKSSYKISSKKLKNYDDKIKNSKKKTFFAIFFKKSGRMYILKVGISLIP